MSDATDPRLIVERLNKPVNWLQQVAGPWKDTKSRYDRTPYEAAAALTAALDRAEKAEAGRDAARAKGRDEGIREAAAVAKGRWQKWKDGNGISDADGLPAVVCDVTACENIASAILALLDAPKPSEDTP